MFRGYRHRIGKELIKKKKKCGFVEYGKPAKGPQGQGQLKLTSGSSQTEREEGQRGGGQ